MPARNVRAYACAYAPLPGSLASINTALLNPSGRLFVQTQHPVFATGDQAYHDG
ncbi:hypothetical protein [Acidihalobacter yilgarnensis]|uniref:hypothetical protein n=1 Tax=Acidihalobacter yilgarnensis TaxID=2819280 RepID=UPI0012EA1C68|nr:hypothetical protein [Acidihalobacter yilgarnensis]